MVHGGAATDDPLQGAVLSEVLWSDRLQSGRLDAEARQTWVLATGHVGHLHEKCGAPSQPSARMAWMVWKVPSCVDPPAP